MHDQVQKKNTKRVIQEEEWIAGKKKVINEE